MNSKETTNAGISHLDRLVKEFQEATPESEAAKWSNKPEEHIQYCLDYVTRHADQLTPEQKDNLVADIFPEVFALVNVFDGGDNVHSISVSIRIDDEVVESRIFHEVEFGSEEKMMEMAQEWIFKNFDVENVIVNDVFNSSENCPCHFN
jgi:hypothetical protein